MSLVPNRSVVRSPRRVSLRSLAIAPIVLLASWIGRQIHKVQQGGQGMEPMTTATPEHEWHQDSLTDNWPVGVLRFDRSGQCVYANQRWSKMADRPCTAALGQGWLAVLHPDDCDRITAEWRESCQQGNPYQTEGRYLQPTQGQTIWFYCQIQPEIAPGEILRGYVATLTDITDRKHTELALQRSEQCFRTLFEGTPTPIQGYDRNRRVIFWNPASTRLYGYTYEEAIGRTVEELIIPPAMREMVLPLVDRWIAGDGDPLPDGELELQGKDGSKIAVYSSHVVLTNSAGEREMYCIDLDLRDRKQAELALQQLNGELEERIDQRTLELQAAKELADAANQAKSEFLANMSHELRTPLNGILGYAQILGRSKTLANKDLNGVHIIHQCGSHLLTLINDVLDLSKIEARKLDLTPKAFHTGAFLQSVVEICRIRAEQKGIEFIYHGDPQLPTGIEADEKRLRQVLINLIGNAIKFTDQGSVTFSVECIQPSTPGKTRLQFKVADTGVGIAPEDVAKLFQAFEQVGDRKRQTEGTGLGLAISQQIVQLMGGRIQVKSQPGVGSDFFFDVELPVAQDWVQQSVTDAGKRITGYAGQTRQILVVDDRWENRGVLRNLLEPLGFVIREAENGLEALQALRQELPDLVITDLVMPVMDGFEFLQQVRQSDNWSQLKVLVSSASVTQADQRRAIETGGDEFLIKPVDASELFTLLKRHLELEWQYEAVTHEAASTGAATELVLPPAETLTNLLELVQQDNLTALRQQLEGLTQANPQYREFANPILQLAKQFRGEAIEALLQRYLTEVQNHVE